MKKSMLKWLAMAGLGLLLWPSAAAAQKSDAPETKAEATPVSVYRLDYVIREQDNGKVLNQRKYSLSVQATRGPGNKDWGRVRVGRRVPVATGGGSGASGATTQFSYMDLGVSLDSSLRENEGSLLLETVMEISSVVTGGELAVPGAPVTRQASAHMVSVLTPGKPTVIGTLDDVDSTHSYQVEVTATRMK